MEQQSEQNYFSPDEVVKQQRRSCRNSTKKTSTPAKSKILTGFESRGIFKRYFRYLIFLNYSTLFSYFAGVYSVWVKDQLKIGMRVRVKHRILESEEGDIGIVLEIVTSELETDPTVKVVHFIKILIRLCGFSDINFFLAQVNLTSGEVIWVRYFEIQIIPAEDSRPAIPEQLHSTSRTPTNKYVQQARTRVRLIDLEEEDGTCANFDALDSIKDKGELLK